MTVNEAVRALGTAIQADPRYQAYMQAKQANDVNAALQEKLGAFHLKRMALQQESGKESADREKLMQLDTAVNTLYAEIMEDPGMQQFQQAKQQMDRLVREVDTIITLCVNGEDPATCHPDLSHCTGDCSSCGGCQK